MYIACKAISNIVLRLNYQNVDLKKYNKNGKFESVDRYFVLLILWENFSMHFIYWETLCKFPSKNNPECFPRPKEGGWVPAKAWGILAEQRSTTRRRAIKHSQTGNSTDSKLNSSVLQSSDQQRDGAEDFWNWKLGTRGNSISCQLGHTGWGG